jgi:UDP-glucose 4-epimerase
MFCAVNEVDRVVHLAARVGVAFLSTSPAEVFDTNVDGTSTVVNACRRLRKPLVYVSSSEVYKSTRSPPYRETDPCIDRIIRTGREAYGSSKACGEKAVDAAKKDIPALTIRPFNVSGPRQIGDFGMVLPRFIEGAFRDGSISVYGDGKQKRSFCHVNDFVQCLVRLIDNPAASGKTFNLGSEEPVEIRRLAEEVKKATGVNPKIRFVPFESAYGRDIHDIRERYPSLEYLRSFVDFRPGKSLKELIHDVAAHCRMTATATGYPAK